MTALVLGTFDGVHTAHRALLKEAAKHADDVIACTFDIPPASYFDGDVRVLSTAAEKEQLLINSGATDVFMQKFDAHLAEMMPEEYIFSLCKRFKPDYIVAGFNHHFGKNASGTFGTLSALSAEYHFRAVMGMPFKNGGELVSSTLIRNCLASGNVERAAELLGRRYSLSGTVTTGKHLGAKLGFPTANLEYPPAKCIPAHGVYATLCTLDGRTYKGMTNIGTNPTVSDGDSVFAETHLLGFDGDIYGHDMSVHFIKRVRDEIKFGSVNELKKQLSLDAALINGYLDTVK